MQKIKKQIYLFIICLLFSSITHAVDLEEFNEDQNVIEFYHIFQQYDSDHSILSLKDGSQWKINQSDNFIPEEWNSGDRLKMAYHKSSSSTIELINVETANFETVWGSYENGPHQWESIAQTPHDENDPDPYKTIILKNGWVFLSQDHIDVWDVGDAIFIFHNGTEYDLWNPDRKQILFNFSLVEKTKYQHVDENEFSNILMLEERLNARVLGQHEASQAVAASMLNYVAGLTDPKKPAGAFLFIGPSGVGKTELAKVLTEELYHNSDDHLIRFDMSHFNEPHSTARLIGAPTGYVGHEEGGQLTESLKTHPQSVVLLDEMEKANSTVHKLFLPIFDEGYIADAKNEKVNCKQTVFILTSNLCSKEISSLFNMNYSSRDVLAHIEPSLMTALSPELYNRLEPVLFRPIEREIMEELVEMQLNLVVKRIRRIKNMTLILDNSVKEYIIENGFHPDLGARPLKSLIEKKIVANIAKAMIRDGIPEKSQITVSYSLMNDSWLVEWCHAYD